MKNVSCILTTLLFATTLQAQQLNPIRLNTPDKTREAKLMKAFEERKSATEYSDKMLSIQDLSDLFWAANGINRPEEGKRTAASAMNRQDVILYAFTPEGVYLYDAEAHELTPITAGDYRKLFGERGMSPLIVLLVSDIGKFGDAASPELRKEWSAIDIGLVSQNIALFCAGNGIGTRPRAGMDREALKELLHLTDTQLPMLNNAVGYPR